jgi:hypothetical protein
MHNNRLLVRAGIACLMGGYLLLSSPQASEARDPCMRCEDSCPSDITAYCTYWGCDPGGSWCGGGGCVPPQIAVRCGEIW